MLASILGPILGPKAGPGVQGRGPLIMHCQTPQQVPVLSTLAFQFAVCSRWFCSVPRETWPNRNFVHAATSDGATIIETRFYENTTIFELLEQATKTWRIYYDDTPEVSAFKHLWDAPDRARNWFRFGDFATHVQANDLPHYSFIEPNHRPPMHMGQPDQSNNQHPGNNLVPDGQYDGYAANADGDLVAAAGSAARGDLAKAANCDLATDPNPAACQLRGISSLDKINFALRGDAPNPKASFGERLGFLVPWRHLYVFLGVIITGIAVSFGSSFWLALLKRLVGLRGGASAATT